MSRFALVHLSEDRELDGRLSQTMLRHYNGCARSGFLYQKYKGEAQTIEMVRGKALHAVIERSIALMVKQGESMIPPEIVKAVLNEVLAEMPVPVEEHDYLREMVFRWASEWMVNPMAIVANETLFVLDLGGYQVRARIDFAEQTAKDRLHVWDWKSSRYAPPYDEIARKRPTDGTMAAKNFQLVLYGVMLMFGLPVVRERCIECDHYEERCRTCGGKGFLEIPGPAPVGVSANCIDLEFVYPGIETGEGRMLRRSVGLTRLELSEYRESLMALVARVAESERTGDWPAVVSDAACGECPCRRECPIRRETAPLLIGKGNEALAAEHLYVLTARTAEVRKALKARAKETGQLIRFGKDRVWEFDYRESERIDNKEGMFAAMGLAVERGEPFEREKWVKTVRSTQFVERQLTADELEAEREGL